MMMSSSKLKLSPPIMPVRRWVPKSEKMLAKMLYFREIVCDQVRVARRETSRLLRSTLMNEAETVALMASSVLPIERRSSARGTPADRLRTKKPESRKFALSREPGMTIDRYVVGKSDVLGAILREAGFTETELDVIARVNQPQAQGTINA